MNNENIVNYNNVGTNMESFDFSKNWNDDFIADDDDIIIGPSKKENSDVSFEESFGDDSFSDSKNVFSFEPIVEENNSDILFDEKSDNGLLSSNSTELDSFFDSIYNGVEDANDLISQINLKKQTLIETEKELSNLKEQIDREKAEFSKYMDSQRQALEIERKQLKEKTELQRLRLSEESAQVKNDVEVKNNELELREQKLKVEIEKLEMQKANFAKYKEVEEEKIKNSLDKLNIEKEQIAKERDLAMQTIENDKKEFAIEKEHFERIKQIEESKLQSERDNLNKNCERFKRLISSLSSNFNSMPGKE